MFILPCLIWLERAIISIHDLTSSVPIFQSNHFTTYLGFPEPEVYRNDEMAPIMILARLAVRTLGTDYAR
jgi:hypothetical protein